MAMKMSKARYKGNEINVTTYNNGMHGNINCYYCPAKVSFVRKHKRTIGHKEITINSYFRLSAGNNHGEMCRYTVEGELQDIFAKHADKEYLTKVNDKYIVRLLLVNKSKNEYYQNTFEDGRTIGKRRELNYIPNGKKTAYLSTLKRIIMLHSVLEDDLELQERVTLKFTTDKGFVENIPWKNFVFDIAKENEQERMYDYLKASALYHPICICGIISKINHAEGKKYSWLNFKEYSVNDKEKISISLRISEKNAKELSNFVNRKVAIYSDFSIHDREWGGKDGKPKTLYHNINGDAWDKNQIFLINQEE